MPSKLIVPTFVARYFSSRLMRAGFGLALGVYFLVAPLSSVAAGASETLRNVVFEASSSLDSPPHYNWFKAGADRRRGAIQAMFEPLFRYESDGSLSPWLAKSYTHNEDYTRFTATLDRRAKWSDGRYFHVIDIIFSVENVLHDPRLDGHFAEELRDVVDAVTADPTDRDHKIIFDLKRPDPRFIEQYFSDATGDSFTVVQKRLWKDVDLSGENVPSPMGTGPYEPVRLDPNEAKIRAEWVLLDAWWGEELQKLMPSPEKLIWLTYRDAESRIRSLTRGQADATQTMSPGLFRGLTEIATFADGWPENRPFDIAAGCPRGFWFIWPDIKISDAQSRQTFEELVDELRQTDPESSEVEALEDQACRIVAGEWAASSAATESNIYPVSTLRWTGWLGDRDDRRPDFSTQYAQRILHRLKHSGWFPRALGTP